MAGRQMPNLTDRQRFALRESLCDLLVRHSNAYAGTSWDAESLAVARRMIDRSCDGYGIFAPFAKQLVGLVELLGEWPVGYRGEKGWEKVEL